MKSRIVLSICMMLLVASCGKTTSSRKSGETIEIDIANGVEELTELKASDLGKTIRYVPLETTDSCLIGNNPRVRLLRDNILVITEKQCFLFDKQTGKFLCPVGHIGQDPEGYSETMCWINDETGIIYFFRKPDQLIKYNQQGKMVGKVTIPQTSGAPNYFTFSDSTIIGHYGNMMMGVPARSLVFFTESGTVLDTVPSLLPASAAYTMGDVTSFSIFRSTDLFGNLGLEGLFLLDFKDDTRIITAPNASLLWKCDGDVHFQEMFTDTIYTVQNQALQRYLVFNTGEYHWPVEERMSKENKRERIRICYLVESPAKLFFQFTKGAYYDRCITYNGVYDKESGMTKMAKAGAGFTDDLTHFMPVYPTIVSEQGEYATLVGVPEMQKWLEEHPEIKAEGKLDFLKRMDEDANPVVVILEP